MLESYVSYYDTFCLIVTTLQIVSDCKACQLYIKNLLPKNINKNQEIINTYSPTIFAFFYYRLVGYHRVWWVWGLYHPYDLLMKQWRYQKIG